MSEPTDPKAVQEQIMRIIRLKEAAERDRESARKYREETKKLKAKIAATPINEDGRKAYKELKALIDCAEACQTALDAMVKAEVDVPEARMMKAELQAIMRNDTLVKVMDLVREGQEKYADVPGWPDGKGGIEG